MRKGQIYNNIFRPILWKSLDEETLIYDYSEINTNLLKPQTLELNAESVDTSDKKKIQAGAMSVGDRVLTEIKQILKSNGITAPLSFKTVVISLIKYINEKQGWTTVDGKIQGLVIMENIDIIDSCLVKVLMDYHVEINKDISNLTYNEKLWSPPEELWFEEDAVPNKWSKYAYQKQYYNPTSRTNQAEFDYSDKIDDDDTVAWWFKNGDRGADHFSIPYGEGKNFYPDFIIKYNNGDIKLAETKGSHLISDAKKAALEAYGIKHNILTEWVLDGVIEKPSITEEEIVVIKEEAAQERKNLFVTFSDHAIDRYNSRCPDISTKDIITAITTMQDEFWTYREFDNEKGSWGIEVKIGGLNLIIKGAYYEEKNRFVIVTLYPPV